MCLLGFYDWDLGKNYVIVHTCNIFYFLRNRLVSDGDYRSMNRTDDQAGPYKCFSRYEIQ